MKHPHSNQPIKVLWVIPSLEGGGAERAIVTILKHLDRQRVEPTLCLFNKKGVFLAEVTAADIPIVSLENGRFTPHNILKLSQLIKQLNPDFTIGVLRRCSMLTTLAHKLSGNQGKLFINEQNTPSVEMKQFGNYAIKRLGYKPFLRLADGVLVLSKGIAVDLRDHFQLPIAKSHLIPNPIDLSTIQEKSQQSIEHPWFDTKYKTIVSVGRLHPQKGHDILIKAFAQVKTAVSDAKLVIIGTGPEKDELITQIKNLSLKDEVDLIGFQDNPYVFMAKSDLFVLASRYEGFGIVLAETLALNTAVIATDCPSGPSDILDNGKAGTLVPVDEPNLLAQAIIKALQNPNALETQKAHGQQHIKQFTETAVAEQYMLFFEQKI